MNSSSQKIAISVYGAKDTHTKTFEILEIAENLGKIIAEHDCNVTVPATTGFPFWVAKGAHKAGTQVIGFSPAAHEREHVEVYGLPTDYMNTIIYSGFGFAGADLLLSRSSDAIIFGYGGLETVHEFWVAFQENKPIGVLNGEWETDEILFGLLRGNEATFDHSRIIFDDDPTRLLEQLIKKAKENRVADYHIT
ncbi:MAG: putative Rossmann-fold nucleotide-binding protein [Candidatus Paceibacteria bacterium]|jgi:predicted Rossmann-fold nucleotide-binding protein